MQNPLTTVKHLIWRKPDPDLLLVKLTQEFTVLMPLPLGHRGILMLNPGREISQSDAALLDYAVQHGYRTPIRIDRHQLSETLASFDTHRGKR